MVQCSCSASVQYTEIYWKSRSYYAKTFLHLISDYRTSGKFLWLFSENWATSGIKFYSGSVDLWMGSPYTKFQVAVLPCLAGRAARPAECQRSDRAPRDMGVVEHRAFLCHPLRITKPIPVCSREIGLQYMQYCRWFPVPSQKVAAKTASGEHDCHREVSEQQNRCSLCREHLRDVHGHPAVEKWVAAVPPLRLYVRARFVNAISGLEWVVNAENIIILNLEVSKSSKSKSNVAVYLGVAIPGQY